MNGNMTTENIANNLTENMAMNSMASPLQKIFDGERSDASKNKEKSPTKSPTKLHKSQTPAADKN